MGVENWIFFFISQMALSISTMINYSLRPLKMKSLKLWNLLLKMTARFECLDQGIPDPHLHSRKTFRCHCTSSKGSLKLIWNRSRSPWERVQPSRSWTLFWRRKDLLWVTCQNWAQFQKAQLSPYKIMYAFSHSPPAKGVMPTNLLPVISLELSHIPASINPGGAYKPKNSAFYVPLPDNCVMTPIFQDGSLPF